MTNDKMGYPARNCYAIRRGGLRTGVSRWENRNLGLTVYLAGTV
jgi:hypothetical protein